MKQFYVSFCSPCGGETLHDTQVGCRSCSAQKVYQQGGQKKEEDPKSSSTPKSE